MSEEKVTDRELRLHALNSAVTLITNIGEGQSNVVDVAEKIHLWLIGFVNKEPVSKRPINDNPYEWCPVCRFKLRP